MDAKTIAQRIGRAREVMQHLIEINSPLCERHERLINNLKAQQAAGK